MRVCARQQKTHLAALRCKHLCAESCCPLMARCFGSLLPTLASGMLPKTSGTRHAAAGTGHERLGWQQSTAFRAGKDIDTKLALASTRAASTCPPVFVSLAVSTMLPTLASSKLLRALVMRHGWQQGTTFCAAKVADTEHALASTRAASTCPLVLVPLALSNMLPTLASSTLLRALFARLGSRALYLVRCKHLRSVLLPSDSHGRQPQQHAGVTGQQHAAEGTGHETGVAAGHCILCAASDGQRALGLRLGSAAAARLLQPLPAASSRL